jgi:NADPH2:quinone reductase
MKPGSTPAAWATARQVLVDGLEVGRFRISISRRFPLAEAAEAHRLLESRGSVGKIVLLP